MSPLPRRPPAPRPALGRPSPRPALAGLLLALTALTAHSVSAAPLEVRVLDRAGQPLAQAVVTLESAAARAAVRPARGLEMQQIDRQFVPGVMVVPLGSQLRFPNRDRVRHHVYSISPAKTFELKLFLGNDANPVLFDRPGVAVLGCNIHDEMIGWVVVVETPWHAVTDADGRARLDAPAADYRLQVWHPDLPVGAPAVGQPLTLRDEAPPVTVRLPLGRG
jgi:plastocyanin